jgi:uncharacterized membrane protein YkvA (DUF1232 family)
MRMTSDPDKLNLDAAFIRKGAESITQDDLRRIIDATADFDARFEKPGPIGRVISEINLLRALVSDYWNDEYRQVPWWALAAAAFALIYVLNPVDLLPDAAPIIGQLDDAVVVMACFLLIEQELQSYKAWKREQLPSA